MRGGSQGPACRPDDFRPQDAQALIEAQEADGQQELLPVPTEAR